MLKENWRLISRIEKLGDFFIIVASFFIAYYSRSSLIFWNDILGFNLRFAGDALAPLKDYFIVLAAALIAYFIALHALGAYSSMRLSSVWRLLRIAVVSSLFVFIVLAATLFLLKLDLSRSFIALFCSSVTLLLCAQRFLVLRVLRYWRSRGRNFRNTLVCGVGEQAVRLASEIAKRPELGIRIRLFCDLQDYPAAAEGGARRPYIEFRQQLREAGCKKVARIISGAARFEKALEDYAIDEVIFTDVVPVMLQVEELIVIASEQGVRTTIAADLFSIGMVKSGLSYFGGMPLIHFQTPPGDRWELGVKRGIDILGSAALLLLLSPLMIAVALAILVSDGRPIFYTQKRVGLNGRLFPMYKFRSMKRDAHQELSELLQHNEMSGPVFKMTNDPRVTPIGRLIRRFSIDELPQLWNVLRGEMSLVGPRPPVPEEVSLYQRKNRRRLSMRPGLTCTWQVSGRNNIRDFDALVKLDLEYIDNWSLSRDAMLLLRTVPAVLFGHGAK